MALTHTMPAGAPRATRNQASRATEHDVVDGEDKRLDAELRADRLSCAITRIEGSGHLFA